MTYQFIIFIFKFFYLNSLFFFIQYIIERLNKIFLEFNLIFTIILQIYFLIISKVKNIL